MELRWSFVFLKKDPFLLEAPQEVEATVWADMERARKQLEQIIANSLFSGVTQVIFNRSVWGAGKTHAARYFTNENNVRIHHFDGWIKCIYTRTPKQPEKAVQLFYERILEELRWESIRQWVNEANKALGNEKEAVEFFFSITRDSDLARAVWLLGNLEYNERLLRKYFIGKLTNKELDDLKLAKNLEPSDARQRVAVLEAILKAAMGVEGEQKGRVLIWIDETEDLNLYQRGRQRLLTGLWRDLVDSMPRGLTLFLNYTPAAGELVVDVGGVFGEGLKSRFTDTLSFEPLDEKDALTYVIDLLNSATYREKDSLPPRLPISYPFEEEALVQALAGISARTPRKINLACGHLLRSALQENVFSGPGKGIINAEYVRKKWPDMEQLINKEKGLL